MNRKGWEEVLTLYLIMMMIFSGGVIVLCVLIINGAPVDVRKTEADILANRVIDCIVNQGYLIENFNSEFDLKKNCYFNFYSLENEKIDESQYFVKIEIKYADSDAVLMSWQTADSLGIEDYCILQEEKNKEYTKLPKCVRKEIYSLKDDKEIIISVLTGINKGEKNVR